jgi:flagellar biosynthesis activator protein FlaF
VNASELAMLAYAPTTSPMRSDRSMEHQVMADITSRLSSASGAGAVDFPRLASALHDNRRLWTVLASEVSQADNLLPADLRARIFFLSEYTAFHTSRVLRGEADVASLIEINTAVLRGLSSSSQQIGQA